jgi:hypothetical protein
MDRNWNTTDDWENLKEINDGSKFEDVNFPVTDNDALLWKDTIEAQGDLSGYNVEWKRVSHPDFQNKKLFGPDHHFSISPTDINQGGIGNCW